MNKTLLPIAALALTTGAAAAPVTEMTLDRAIALARTQSTDAAVALDELRSSYWRYRSHRADLLPEVSFSATAPAYSKRYATYMDSDGTYSFVRTSNLELNGTVSVTQNVWLTGGTVSIQSSFDWLRQLGRGAYSRFMAVPAVLTLNQPLFATNTIKWDRRIEPVRYREAKAAYVSQTEQVSITAINYFFSLVLANENLAIARQNLANDEKLYEVALVKRAMGSISENDVLQMRLNVLNSQTALTEAATDSTNCRFRLLSFLGLDDDGSDIRPIVPERLPRLDLAYSKVLEKTLDNNKFALSQRRRQLEADYSVATAKGNLRRVNLYAQVGLTGTGDMPADAYSPLRDNQVVELGISIPLVDWDKRRGRVKVAESNRRVVANTLEREAAEFRQDLFVLVERFNNQQRQVEIAAIADTIASRRYDTNVETFMVGRISTLDLNDSQTARDLQRTRYFQALYAYWNYYYQIRSIALWDFATDSPIEFSDEELGLKK
ncbi:MAG: TolC family protein [Muribaculaceae bacterium]|nr:TolC family protein [Muribaculaceae bacterium]